MNNRIKVVIIVLMLHIAALFSCAGECRLFDGTNYPRLPQPFRGAQVGDYRAKRTMDVIFPEKRSGVQIQCLRGDVQPNLREWFNEDSMLEIEFAKGAKPPQGRFTVEIVVMDPRTKPAPKMTIKTVVMDAFSVSNGNIRAPFTGEVPGVEFIPATLRIKAESPGRMEIARIAVCGSKVTDSSIPVAKQSGTQDHLWLRVKGRHIVTSPLSEGGERPFVAAGVGYGKDVILHGYDEEVAAFCKSMGLNTVRLAFYNLYFNSRADEPLDFYDVAAFIDPVLAAAKRHNLYVILDDHAYFKNEIDEATARGEQKSAGWAVSKFEAWVKAWGRVAERYKNEPRILGYELCNEPVCDPAVARKWYKRAIDEIRKHDKRHSVILGAHHWSHSRSMEATWKGVADKIDAPYNNAVFSFHDYPLDDPPSKVRRCLDEFQNKYNVPVMCTEFGGGGTPERVHRETQAGMLALFAQRGISWMLWTLEDRHGEGQPFPTKAVKRGNDWEVVPTAKPRYWIPFPEIWAPVAEMTASQVPCAAVK